MQTSLRTPTVRPLGRADLAHLTALSRQLEAETADDWARRIGRIGVVIVGAEVDGILVGYAAGEIRRSFGAAPAGWIDAFGVDFSHRGLGMGRALLTALLAHLREAGVGHVYTLVPLHDRTMAPFFRELGFRDEAFIPIGRDL